MVVSAIIIDNTANSSHLTGDRLPGIESIDLQIFEASKGWVYDWKKGFKVALRPITKVGQKLTPTKEDIVSTVPGSAASGLCHGGEAEQVLLPGNSACGINLYIGETRERLEAE